MAVYGTTGGSADAIRQAASAEGQAAAAQRNVGELEDKVERLTLVCAALWELVKERNGLTEEALVERIAILDAKDGVADGKMTRTVKPCGKCGRPVSPKHQKCIYCGADRPITTVFEGI